MSATLRAHDQLVQALRLRIAKLQKMAFGKSSEKVEREIEQLELALEDLFVAIAEQDKQPIDERQDDPKSPSLPRRRPRVSDDTVRERRELDPGKCCGIANLLSPDRAERKLCLSGGHFGSVAFPEVECVGPGVAK